jgi:hypothetical protein
VPNGLIRTVVLGALFAGGPWSASASTLNLQDVYNPTDLLFSRSGLRSIAFTHDLTAQGFDPATDTLTDATLSLYMRDDNDPSAEMVDVSLDDLWDFNNQKITSGTGPTQFTFTVTALVNGDGVLNVSLTRQNGTFYFEQSVLDVQGTREDVVVDTGNSEEVSVPVPEPASLSLLGLGLAGMGVRRWRQRRPQ